MVKRIIFISLFFLTSFAFGQEQSAQSGIEAVAGRYALYIERMLSERFFMEEQLLRALEYADVSSDISYLAALVWIELDKPAAQILDAARDALAVNKFRRYRREDASLVETRMLLRLRRYSEALLSARNCRDDADAAALRLDAWKGLDDRAAFAREAGSALDRFPYAAGIVERILRYAVSRTPSAVEETLLGRCLRAVYPLSETAPSLLYLAAPFIYDNNEARRMLLAYRAAVAKPSAESLAVSLECGVIGEESAIDELFSLSTLTKNDIETVFSQMRSDFFRKSFMAKLNSFSGIIKNDADKDQYYESKAVYTNGRLISFDYDERQDGKTIVSISFTAEFPSRVIIKDSESGAGLLTLIPNQSAKNAELEDALWLWWDDYPGLSRAARGDVNYYFAPRTLFYAPVRLSALLEEGGLIFPLVDNLVSKPAERTLGAFALVIARNSREFEGAIETITLQNGIPIHAEENYAGGRLVSETVFERGFPVLRWLDLDLNGSLESIRYFYDDRSGVYPDKEPKPRALFSDFNGNGIFEYKEEYTPTGNVTRFWDMNEDGIFEYSE